MPFVIIALLGLWVWKMRNDEDGPISLGAVRRAAESLVGAIRFAPHAQDTVDLFRRAAGQVTGLVWTPAAETALHNILSHESNGYVGRPNYTYGAAIAKDPLTWPGVWTDLRAGHKATKSSATGLGQLLLANVDAFYPDGRKGIGDAYNEAVGMLRYLQATYGRYGAAHNMSAPETAWTFYNKAKPAGWGMPPTSEGY